MAAVRPSAHLDRVYRFGDFEYFVRSRELAQNGKVVRLQYQPLRVLLVLLENSGEVVTHDESRGRVWRDASIQAFDNSLRVAINKLRQALRDDPDNPIYIETLSRRGYRWLYPVSVEDNERDSGEGENEPEASVERNNGAATDYSQPAKPTGAALLRRSILSLFVSLVALAAIWQLQPHPATPEPPEPKVVPLTTYPAWNTCRQFRRTANGWRSRGRVRVQRTLQNLREANQRGPHSEWSILRPTRQIVTRSGHRTESPCCSIVVAVPHREFTWHRLREVPYGSW